MTSSARHEGSRCAKKSTKRKSVCSQAGPGCRSPLQANRLEKTKCSIIKSGEAPNKRKDGSNSSMLTTQSSQGSLANELLKDKSSKNVCFTEISIREYNRELGDNPSVSGGCPITIGWCYGRETVETVDVYELTRELKQRRKQGFILSRQEREMIVLELGYTGKDIAKSIREVLRTKRKRRTTVNNIGLVSSLEEQVERAFRKIRKTLQVF